MSNAALTSSVGLFITGGAGGLLWTFLGLFQIVNYLLYLNVNYPYNVVLQILLHLNLRRNGSESN